MTDPLFMADAKRLAADMEAKRVTVAESMKQWAEAVARAVERRTAEATKIAPRRTGGRTPGRGGRASR